MSPERVQTTVDGKVLTLSNLDKVLYPKSGFTKSQVLDYYARIAEVMLPHLKNRPATFKRFPNGVDGLSFYEKHSPAGAPEWVRTISVPSKDGSHEPIDYTEVRDVRTVDIQEDRSVAMTLLFDPEHNLEERILNEQFAP